MEYKIYICRKRAKFKAICGQVNIRYGTILNCQGGFLILNDLPVCSVTSQNAYDFFTQNDDGMGEERGELLNRITATLMKQTPGHNARLGGKNFGMIPVAKSTSARNRKIIGFGIMTSTTALLRICAILPP